MRRIPGTILILTAALVEGAALFGIVIALLFWTKSGIGA